MPDTLNQAPSTNFALLLEFLWGEGGTAHAARYTNWSDAVVAGGNTYTTTPGGSLPNIETRIEVQPSKQTGVVKDEPWTLTMVPVPPLTFLLRNSVWAPVTCTISEVDPTAVTPTPTVLWTGMVSQTWKNPKGSPGCVRAEVSGFRSRIQYPLGPESKTDCIRTFGDAWCGVNLAPIQQTAEITALAGKVLSAPSLTIPGGKPPTWWTLGRVEYDGLSITIVDSGAGVSSLRLLQNPPPEWVGVTATFTPGCNKTLRGGCAVHDNVPRFFGIGIRKPSTSPLLWPR